MTYLVFILIGLLSLLVGIGIGKKIGFQDGFEVARAMARHRIELIIEPMLNALTEFFLKSSDEGMYRKIQKILLDARIAANHEWDDTEEGEISAPARK